MELEHTVSGNALLITVRENRIDALAAVQFKDAMRALTTGGPAMIYLDLKQVEFIDSSGLGAVVASLKQIESHQTMELVHLSSTVAKVFRLTRMDTIFAIHDEMPAKVA